MSDKKYNKAALFTDAHFGRKNNSEVHNQDCTNYIDWFCANAIKNNVDHVIFLGDWHEHRASINGMTLKYSYEGAKKLNALGIPVYFILGNHDLYFRNNRSIYTTNVFESLDNFILVDEPKVFPELGNLGALISPFLLPDEYPSLYQYNHIPVWFGHFEFKGFVITGDTIKMEHGPDPSDFNKPLKIFTGHFHKRQTKGNVHYIGNAFPADYSDANDVDRGMAIYEYDVDVITYINWVECPKYITTTLSQILKSPKKTLHANARVKCLVDTEITYDESTQLKHALQSKYNLRELVMEEQPDNISISEDEIDMEEYKFESTGTIIKALLKQVKSDKIDNDMLVKIYETL